MPVQTCRANGRPGYKYGPRGHCYDYEPGDDHARREAKRKAIIQGVAEGESPAAGATNGLLFTADVEKAMKEVEHSELGALEKAWQRALEKAAAYASTRFAITAAADWQPPVEGGILTTAQLTALAAALNKELLPIWTRVVLDTANPPLAQVEISWDIKHPITRRLLEQAAQRTGARLSEAAQFILRNTLASAYEQGFSVRETSALIQSAMTEAAPWQADMLARTDLNSLANGASKEAAQEAGITFKTWLATLDDKTRPEHVEADGQTVPVNDTFLVGGEEADYPGDPNLSDAMAANCRCTLIYGDTLDEAQALLSDAGGIMPNMTSTRTRAKRAAKKKPAAAQEALLAAAIPVHHTGVVSGTWDGNAAMGRASSAADFRSICAWVESGAPADQRGSYKFPHHAQAGGPANINGVRNALARLPQANIPEGDRAGVEAHLRAHLNDFNKRQGNNAIEGFEELSLEEALATFDQPVVLAVSELMSTPLIDFDMLSPEEHQTLRGLLEKASPDEEADVWQANAWKKERALVAAPKAIAFSGTAAIEGKIADDNSLAPRVLLPNSLSWPEMPVSFMAQTVTSEGHDGAEIAGRVDEFARKRGQRKGMYNIDFKGELTTPFGVNEIAPMLEDKTMRYVSADLGATEWAIVNRDSFDVVAQEDLDINALQEGAYALGLKSGKFKAVTLVPTQAIEGAMVALTASADEYGIGIEKIDEDEYRIVVPLDAISLDAEAILASAADWTPPREWFDMPELPGKMPLTVTKEGRVYGHLCTWDSCHVSFLPSCLPPPKSASNYAYFHIAELDTAEGDVITVGKMMFSPGGGGHADRQISAAKASQYYDRTGMVAAFGRVSDGTHGIWFAGSLNPSLSREQREEMRRELRLNPPSGDWRPINGQYELICALAVEIPGYPVSRATVTVTASADGGLVLEDAIIASSGMFDADPQALFVAEQMGIADEEAMAERKMRALAARAEGGLDALAALAENWRRSGPVG